MAEAIIAAVVEKIGNLLIENGKFLHGVKDQVEELQTELQQMQWFLRDADVEKIEKDRIRQWVLQVQDIAYDTGDLLESYAFRVGSRRGGGCAKVLHRCECLLNECCLPHELGSEIKALNSKISNIKQSLQAYGVRSIMEKEGSSSRQPLLRWTYSFVEEEDFVGLENDVDLLVQHLVSKDERAFHRVVSISGMGGSGKTTIANKVYNHRAVKRYFAGSAWICVSQQWQTKDILQRIMVKLVPEKREDIERNWREDELIGQLFEIQKQKKCLVVLDDIWTVDAWECIKQAFPNEQRGSKILLTTRNREVALHIGPDGFHHQPRLLSNDESWDLLRRKALRGRYIEEHMNTNLNEMEELGKKMAERCGGLPLAVVVLGGILSTKCTLTEWETVHQNMKVYLWKRKSIGQDKGDIERILALSYYDLPYQLKPCFLYLSCLPEDAKIKAETLYQLWIAEGMVLMKDRDGEESMMEVAERYLGELGQRGMVQLQIPELPGIRRFESCSLHDLMRDLCLREAEEEGFLKSINFSSGGADVEPFHSLSAASICKLRRLVINLEREDVCRYIPPKKVIRKHLRMLRFVVSDLWSEKHLPKRIKSQFYNCHMLQVLSIEGLSPFFFHESNLRKFVNGWRLPKAIGKLIRLRYLSLRDSCFVTLPSSLGKLKHLHTLDLRLQYVCRLPNILWKIKTLTCLYLPNWFDLDYQCGKLRLDGLSKLEVLENFNDTHYYTEDLCKLNNLRVLVVEWCGELENLAMIANYAETTKTLQQVSIKAGCGFTFAKEKGLPILKQLLFGRNIYDLSIQRKLWKFPECELNLTSSLVTLVIDMVSIDVGYSENEDVDVDVDVMVGTLEKFSLLRSLTLGGFNAQEMTFHATGFSQLRELVLFHFSNLKTWVVEEGSMPNLRHLQIKEFPELETVPNGLQFITTLEKLTMRKMPSKFTERIRAGDGEDFHKISHVPTVNILDF